MSLSIGTARAILTICLCGCHTGNIPWGGLNSGSGAYYMVLRGTGASIQQVVTGLTPVGTYTLSFLAAERPGYT